jgi:3-methyladenine DNA glycosylase/8-oxoguanine DNA glycosylase
MSLNQFNRWVRIIYEHGVAEGRNQQGMSETRELLAEIEENDLRELLLSVKGIGEKRADEVMKKIIKKY